MPFKRSLGMPKWYERKQKSIISVEPVHINMWKRLKPLFVLSGHCGVFKGSKRAVLGADKVPLGPLRILKGSESVSNGIISTRSHQTACFVIFRIFLGRH